MTVSDADLSIVTEQLGREPRGVVDISYRTPDGQPAVIRTVPKLPDGTPFPTLYYLTDPRLTAEASRLEVAHVMKWMEARLEEDEQLQADYRNAHEHFLKERNAMEDLGTDFSGGGMPDREVPARLDCLCLGRGPEHSLAQRQWPWPLIVVSFAGLPSHRIGQRLRS